MTRSASALHGDQDPILIRGESYGPSGYASCVGYKPVLVSAQGAKGEDGYPRQKDMETVLRDLPGETCPP